MTDSYDIRATGAQAMNEDLQKTFRTYAWGYFVQHAEQRLKTFNFYVVFCTVVIGAFATIASKSGLSRHFFILPLLLPIFSFVFWKLDLRTKGAGVKSCNPTFKHHSQINYAIDRIDRQAIAPSR